MTELPLVVVNSQRGGPSTGLPTKTEQSDLYQAVYGRNADSPVPVLAARSPADAFDCAIEACRIATRYMTPVMLLTDGYIANAAEPWRVPDMSDYQPFPVSSSTRRRRKARASCPMPATATSRGRGSARARRGSSTASAGSRKQPGTGNIDYRPEIHQEMTNTRIGKVLGVANSIPDQEVCSAARRRARGRRLGLDLRSDPPGGRRALGKGQDVAHVHVRHIWPMPGTCLSY